MTLKISVKSWPHDHENSDHASLAGGPITLKNGWPHEAEKISLGVAP
jgi:hypothetical protein